MHCHRNSVTRNCVTGHRNWEVMVTPYRVDGTGAIEEVAEAIDRVLGGGEAQD